MTTQVHPIRETLATVSVGAPIAHGALTVFPLYAAASASPDWLTLAGAGDAVTVTEVSDAGSVPSLHVANHADRPVLLLDGDELIGAKQNRVANTTVLIGAKATATIPVSCVEQGRWSYRGRRSQASEYSLYASVRRKKAARVSTSLRQRGRHDADQGEVWNELADKAAFLGVQSPTGAMHDVYERYGETVKLARDAVAATPDQTGAIVYVAGEWAGLELLATSVLFAEAWRRISTGYIADALGRKASNALQYTPAETIARVLAATLEPAPAVGLGAEYRINGNEAVGAALVVDGLVVHLATFPAVAD